VVGRFGLVYSFSNWQCVALFYHIFCFFYVYLVSLRLGFFSPDLPADTLQLHDGCVLGLLGPDREALNSHSESAKVSIDSFTSTLKTWYNESEGTLHFVSL
jgi:hypothetical protein